MFPAIHFCDLDVKEWLQLVDKKNKQFPFIKLHAYLDALRIKVKDAAGYTWDNTHFFIEDIYGKVAVIIQFSPDGSGFAMWNYRNGVSLGEFTVLDLKQIKEIVSNCGQGLTQCNQCLKWIPNKDIVPYSFAGGVCKKCYDPKRHLPPDTSGS